LDQPFRAEAFPVTGWPSPATFSLDGGPVSITRRGIDVREIEVRILNRQEGLPLIAGMVSRFGAENGLAPRILHDVNVVLDEALSNIIAYGYETDVQSEITIRLEYSQDEMVVVIEDRGRPFDPLQAPPPDLNGSVRTRKVGGLGVHFLRSLMDDVAYSRRDGVNRLRMTKKITS